MFALEICLVAVCGALALSRPDLGDRFFSKCEQRLAALAQRKRVIVLSCGLAALAIRAALLPILPIPQPLVHDEYSYLLLADTLIHGRLANPTHPMWVHFETFHVNWLPTYASMYYPGYALFLALGQVVMGHPFWGVWFSGGLMCAAVCWCLQGWLPPGWALMGSFIALIRLATFSYWVDSYWGGTVIAIGGALALGALPRIKERQRTGAALLMALGMTLLAWTRPYEGLFFCVPILIALGWWASHNQSTSLRRILLQIILPAGIVMALTLAMLGFYFYRVTGSPFTIPYKPNMQTYGLVYFPWEKLKPIAFHHQIMQLFYRGGPVAGSLHFAIEHPLKLQFYKFILIWLFYFGPLLSMPIFAWMFARPRGHFWEAFSPDLRFILLLILVGYVSVMLTIYVGQPHYAAPMTAAFYVLLLLVMRQLHGAGTHGAPWGRFLARCVPLICLLLFVLRVSAPLVGMTPKSSWVRNWCSQDSQNLDRARIQKQLKGTPGEHLVIVRYLPGHDFMLDEWVFNNADIDGSKVIWARDMGPEKNKELLHYFNGRSIWLIEPDINRGQLKPYS